MGDLPYNPREGSDRVEAKAVSASATQGRPGADPAGDARRDATAPVPASTADEHDGACCAATTYPDATERDGG